jgi:HJR/Mrr/RecB family endonuclease
MKPESPTKARVIEHKIEEVPHFFDFTKNDFIGDCPGMATLPHDPFPDKKVHDIVRREEIARKLVLHAKLAGDVIDIRPGVCVKIEGKDFAVTAARIAINTENDQESTSEIEGEHFLTPPEPLKFLAKWRNQEEIYRDDLSQLHVIKDITEELKKYLARYPEKLHDLTPRKFEELIADILRDFGFTTELTRITRDGGRDIYAYIKNAVTSFLMFVECKKWSERNRVGIEVVQRLHGAAKAGGAHKAMIVTTSFFTLPAQRERAKIATELELADYNQLKNWLLKYK